MYFQIRKLILWPRKEAEPRVVNFEPGVVNVISGASKTGKSAVIPIIDYCLGAEKCAIPVGVIRENCAWFGVVVDTLEGQKLLARREPGDQQSTGDMFMIEAPQVEVPERIESKNTTAEAVKNMLNQLSGLTGLGFEPNAEVIGYKAHPSFRDLMAFTFQPQNIVANPDVMFFKADTTEHRERLKTIFPYILGAVTPEVLQARWELERLQRLLRQKESELKTLESATNSWRLEAQAWLRQAVELGLLSANEKLPDDWHKIMDLLRKIEKASSRQAVQTFEGMDATLSRLEILRENESEVAAKLAEHRQRLNELRRLLESSQAYGGAIQIQRDRLELSKWLRNLQAESDDPLVAVAGNGREKFVALCDKLEGLEVQFRAHPSLSNSLNKELIRERGFTETALAQLNSIHKEITTLERDSQAAKEQAYRFDSIDRFLGRLEQALQVYDRADDSSGVRDEIAKLKSQIQALQKIVSETDIRQRTQSALDRIQNHTSRSIPKLDAEWPEAPIRLVIPELTIKVLRENRDDYLWEIGSGANWLAYHVALTLALQKFFLANVYHSVPGMLVYDQPSQVYFPKRSARVEDDEDMKLKDEDVEAVRKVFALLGQEVLDSNGRLQIIVLDHADDGVWGGLAGIKHIDEWRGGEKLVPLAWLEPQ